MNDKNTDPRRRHKQAIPTAKNEEVEKIKNAKNALEKTASRNQFKQTVSDDERKMRPM